MSIKLVVFDMSGTTVKDNNDVHYFLQKALSREGVEVTYEEINTVMGYPKPEAIKQLLQMKMSDPLHISHDYIFHIHDWFVNEMVNFYTMKEDIGEKEGVSATFKALKDAGITVAIDTGFDRKIADAIIERLEWKKNNLIDVSVTSDEVEHGRPFPDMIFKCMKLAGVFNNQHVAKVGDTASDLQQGKAAGCKYIFGVTTGSYSEEALKQYPHTHLIKQLPEILPILISEYKSISI